MATLDFCNKPLLDALSAQSIAKITDFHFQDLSNTAWSFARMGFADEPLMHSIASEAINKIYDFDGLGLSNLLWAYAKLEFEDKPLLAAISEAAIAKINSYSSQNLANTAWSMAKLGVTDMPLMEAIAAAAIPKLKEFTAFDLSIFVWAFDILNLIALVIDFLPDAMRHFHQSIGDSEDFGMFWFDFANVVSVQVPPTSIRADFEQKFNESLLDPVIDGLTALSRTDTDHGQAFQAWQDQVELRQIPYLGPAYSSHVLSLLGVVSL